MTNRIQFFNEITLMEYDVRLVDKGSYFFNLISIVKDNKKEKTEIYNVHFNLADRIFQMVKNGKVYKNTTANVNRVLPNVDTRITDYYRISSSDKLEMVDPSESNKLYEKYVWTEDYGVFLEEFFNMVEVSINAGMYNKVFNVTSIMNTESSDSLGKSLIRFIEKYPAVELIYRAGVTDIVPISSRLLSRMDSEGLNQATTFKELFGLSVSDIRGETSMMSDGKEGLSIKAFDSKYGTSYLGVMLENFADSRGKVKRGESPKSSDFVNTIDKLMTYLLSQSPSYSFEVFNYMSYSGSERPAEERGDMRLAEKTKVFDMLALKVGLDDKDFKAIITRFIIANFISGDIYRPGHYTSTSPLYDLLFTYGYDPIKLTDYLLDPTNSETYNSSKLMRLRDYISMSEKIMSSFLSNDDLLNDRTVRLRLKKKYRKYPKNLDVSHGIAVIEYNDLQFSDSFNTENVELFNNRIAEISKSYKLEHTNKKMGYSIILPSSVQDMYMEGIELHNCVFSYVEYVTSGSSLIFFLRRSDDIDVPYVTIEVNPDTLNITQLSGYGDSVPDSFAYQCIEDWVKSKNSLTLN